MGLGLTAVGAEDRDRLPRGPGLGCALVADARPGGGTSDLERVFAPLVPLVPLVTGLVPVVPVPVFAPLVPLVPLALAVAVAAGFGGGGSRPRVTKYTEWGAAVATGSSGRTARESKRWDASRSSCCAAFSAQALGVSPAGARTVLHRYSL